MQADIVILGIFVADTAFRASRQPVMGETILGEAFHLSPGGKGSNQAVAAAKAGARTAFITKLGTDAFADMALSVWQQAGVQPAVSQHSDASTGAAYIFIEAATGNNAIIVCPGIAGQLGPNDISRHQQLIASAQVFMVQLEQPLEAALCGLEIARAAGTTTILNPAPAASLPEHMLGLCDYITPNETEAEALTGISVQNADGARRAAEALCRCGVGTAIITLGERGAYLHNDEISQLIPAFHAGLVAETTGAGDAFNGGFAAALVAGLSPFEATRFGCATAALSVTRPGTASSMPAKTEIQALLSQNP